MIVFSSMASLSLLNSLSSDVYKDSDNGMLWIFFDAFYGYLLKSASKDKDKITFKKVNIHRFFANETCDIQMRDGKEYVRLRSILKFVFQYMSKVTICHLTVRIYPNPSS